MFVDPFDELIAQLNAAAEADDAKRLREEAGAPAEEPAGPIGAWYSNPGAHPSSAAGAGGDGVGKYMRGGMGVGGGGSGAGGAGGGAGASGEGGGGHPPAKKLKARAELGDFSGW